MGFLETLLIVGGGIAIKEGVAWLFKRKVMQKIPKELRGPAQAIAIAGAGAALKKFADEQKLEPPPIPRGKK